MEEKVNNITINLTSLVDYIKDKDLEIETWRYKHLKEFKEKKKFQEQLNKQKEVLDKIKEYCNNRLEYYNEMRRDYNREFDGYAENDIENILELLEEIE